MGADRKKKKKKEKERLKKKPKTWVKISIEKRSIEDKLYQII
jgi:hypothetical protein